MSDSDDFPIAEQAHEKSKSSKKSRKRKHEDKDEVIEQPVVESEHKKTGKKQKKQQEDDGESAVVDENSAQHEEVQDNGVTKKKKKKEKKAKNSSENIPHSDGASRPEVSSTDGTGSSTATDNDRGRHYTVAIALPGSIIANAQSAELKSYLAGQIARACVVFNVDEIVIFDETGKGTEGAFESGQNSNPNVFLAHVLQYLEMPQYLRKCFFPQHPNLRYAGLLNPLDSPNHMRIDEDVPYRDGITLDRPTRAGPSGGSLVNCGMRKEVRIDQRLRPGTRVTVKIDNSDPNKRSFSGTAVAPSEPREAAGLYWGYTVRLASCLSDVFTACPYEGGYDLTVGTSERGKVVFDASLPKFKHMLIVFGGVQGLETSLEADQSLTIDDVSLLFDFYLNTCPDQGSRTIRTEEAVLITMSALRPKILSAGYHP